MADQKLVLRTIDPSASEKAAALTNVRAALPHLFIAANAAIIGENGNGTVHLAVVVKHPDGSGRVGATFMAGEFLRDLDTITWSADDTALRNLENAADDDE